MDIKKVALAIFVIISTIGIAFSAWPQGNSNRRQRENMSDIEARGKQLRIAIDLAYKKLSDEHAIMFGVSITDTVVKYIPDGSSFDEAEAILRAAGFKVYPHQPNPNLPERDPNKYAVFATIDQYVSTLACKISVNVVLRPRRADDYSVVQKIAATIQRACL